MLLWATEMRAELFPIPGFTDPFSSLSHLLGAVIFAGMSVPLVRRGLTAKRARTGRAEQGRVASLVIFAVSAVLLLSMSGVFHLLPAGQARHVLQRLDHAAIFVLIAGTATPVYTILFRGRWRWGMLTLLWTMALTGVTLKSIYFRDMPQTIGLVLYVVMGWIGVASLRGILRRCGVAWTMALLFGGVAYTVGAAVELASPRPLIASVIRAHEIFHVAVLIGLALHWRFVWLIADVPGGGIRAGRVAAPVVTQVGGRDTAQVG